MTSSACARVGGSRQPEPRRAAEYAKAAPKQQGEQTESDVSDSKPPHLEYASREQQPWFVMHWGGWLMLAAIVIAAAFLAYKQVIAG